MSKKHKPVDEMQRHTAFDSPSTKMADVLVTPIVVKTEVCHSRTINPIQAPLIEHTPVTKACANSPSPPSPTSTTSGNSFCSANVIDCPPSVRLYLGNFDSHVSCDDIAGFVRTKGFDVRQCFRGITKNKEESAFFILRIVADDISRLLRPNLWPKNVTVRPFRDVAVLSESVGGISRSDSAVKKESARLEMVQMEDFETLEELTDEFGDIDWSSITTMSTECSQPASVYPVEKKNVNKPKVRDGKVVKQRKKGRPMTAYTLWCRDHRPSIVTKNPHLDFAGISRRLGEVWQSLPDKEKMFWKRQAKFLLPKTVVNSGTSGDSQANSISRNKQRLPAETLVYSGTSGNSRAKSKPCNIQGLSAKTLVNCGKSGDSQLSKPCNEQKLLAKTLINSDMSGDSQPKSKPLNKQTRTIYYTCY